MLAPSNEADLAEMVAAAAGPLAVRGGGTRPIAGMARGEPLSVAGIAGITLYEPGALTLVARAGTPLRDVDAALAEEGQRLAFEPMDHRALIGTDGDPTIGGVVAANVSGPRRIQAGACRDSLLGVRFVDGRGSVLKNGGRVMKNVTGYDLVKLLCGSFGTLGVLSEVSLKVLPRPEASATLAWDGLDLEATLAIMTAALGTPFEVTGAACLPAQDGRASATLLRIEGFSDSVRYRVGALAKALAGPEPDRVVHDPGEQAALWREVRDVTPFADAPGDVWRVSVKPTDLPRALGTGGFRHLVDWGGGLIWTLVPEGTDLRAQIAVPGHATLVRASAETRARLGTFHPEPAPLAAISAGVRAKFDPRGILNPGVMG
ncbi:FAD-binding protein [Tropicimonas marinistellae]|uniref:FAD-binding protein n=1 Tax=Tropicimonas marinistellae TaxID=1739787 RepID=UPI000831935A|nr:FAD-binding protein [Tropicimonas marinistellae]